MEDSRLFLVESAFALVVAHVAGRLDLVRAPLRALALALCVKALLVTARVLARVCHLLHTASLRCFLCSIITAFIVEGSFRACALAQEILEISRIRDI